MAFAAAGAPLDVPAADADAAVVDAGILLTRALVVGLRVGGGGCFAADLGALGGFEVSISCAGLLAVVVAVGFTAGFAATALTTGVLGVGVVPAGVDSSTWG